MEPKKNFENKGKSKHNKKKFDDSDNKFRKNKSVSNQPCNDPEWYMISENIGKAAASLPFNRFSGTKVASYPYAELEDVGAYKYGSNSIPGILAINYASVPGYSDAAVSAINVASRSIYSFVRHVNSGSRNYESPDLMMYIYSMSHLYIMLGEAKRIYRTAMTYSGVNRYIPGALLRSMKVNPDSIYSNLAQFRYGINLLIARASSLYVPKAFSLFERQALLSGLVLLDSSSVRSQFYVFQSSHRAIFEPTKYETGSAMSYSFIEEDRSYQDVLNEISNVLTRLLEDEDINIMSGDILKAYGAENCLQLQELEESETQLFTYNEDLLNQIENANCVYASPTDVGNSVNVTVPDITQRDGYIVWRAEATAGNLTAISAMRTDFANFFNSHKDEPDWKDCIEWSRLLNTVENGHSQLNPYYISCGSELLTSFTLYNYVYTPEGTEALWSFNRFSNNLGQPSESQADNLTFIDRMIKLSNFDWHPILYPNLVDDGGTEWLFDPMGDFKVMTVIDGETAKRLNDLAIMGLFATKAIKE